MTQRFRIDAQPPSLNQMYRGKLKTRIARKKGWESAAAWALREQDLAPVSTYPVEIAFEAVFAPGVRRLDADNLAAAVKVVTDILVRRGVLEGDSPRYVRRVVLGPCRRGETTHCIYQMTEPTPG